MATCQGKELRFLTLTLKSSNAPLGETIDRLYKAFAALRRTKLCRGRMTGGIYMLELTLNNTTKLWHPHLHCLFEGSYIPQKPLAEAWREITGDSYIVDIRALRDERAAAGYVAKYAGKGLSSNVVNDHAALCEVVGALAGRRMFATFGTWRGLGLSSHPESSEEWETVGSLAAILVDATSGNVVARKIISLLRRSDCHDPLTLFDQHPP